MNPLTYIVYHSDQRIIHGGSGNIYGFDILIMVVLVSILTYMWRKGYPAPALYDDSY